MSKQKRRGGWVVNETDFGSWGPMFSNSTNDCTALHCTSLSLSPFPSRKHIILTFLNPLLYSKTGVHMGYTLFFFFLLKNIDCGYLLELPRRGSSNEYPQSMFLSRNMKNISFWKFSFWWWNFLYIWIGVFSQCTSLIWFKLSWKMWNTKLI